MQGITLMKKISIVSFVISVIAITITINTTTQTSLSNCTSCALQRGEKESIGGIIAATNYFEARQDYAVPIPGFIIISSKRHIQSIDECTQEERYDFIEFLHKIRCALRQTVAVHTVYIIQEEDAKHFHVWLFPRYDWMEPLGKK